jgi:REP element-mobilizing transposase RayT
MARPLRVEYPGAVYLVMARAHERVSLFRDDTDREKFLALLATAARQEAWEVHAYCLMSNHYHLLVEIPRGELSHGMHSLNARYSQWFNWRHDRRGHVLEGRFKSVLVQKERYLLELVRYVVLNPVRAGLAARVGDWRWSSYLATAGRRAAPEWLAADWTLSQFARSRSRAREAYRRFVAEGKGSGKDIEKLLERPYLGDEEFSKRVEAMPERKVIEDGIPLRYRSTADVDLETVRKAVAKEWHVEPGALSRSRGGADKKAAIYLARRLTRLKGREIGKAFGVKPARVSNVVTEIEAGRSPALARRVKRLLKRLRQSA